MPAGGQVSFAAGVCILRCTVSAPAANSVPGGVTMALTETAAPAQTAQAFTSCAIKPRPFLRADRRVAVELIWSPLRRSSLRTAGNASTLTYHSATGENSPLSQPAVRTFELLLHSGTVRYLKAHASSPSKFEPTYGAPGDRWAS